MPADADGMVESSAAVSAATASARIGILDSGLAALYQQQIASASPASRAMAAKASATSDLVPASVETIIDGVSYVVVDVTAADGDGAALLPQLQAVGLLHGASFGALAGGLLPTAQIGALLAIGEIAFARSSPMGTNAGVVTTQADLSEHADTARSTYSVDGSGIKVGILSDSFNTSGNADTMAVDIANGDLPSATTILQDSASGTDEGRGMAQLVHDLAPGSAIEFATANYGLANFASNIVALANAGCKVIVDDVSYFSEPWFQDGVVAQAIDQVAAMGVSYFSSAGNTNPGYEGFFSGDPNYAFTYSGRSETPQVFRAELSGVARTLLPVVLYGGINYFTLQWDQPAASVNSAHGAASDLDIFLTDASGNVLSTIAATSNNTGGDPVETFGVSGSGTAYIRVGLHSGIAPQHIRISVFENAAIQSVSSTLNTSTVVGHAAANGAIAVGAASFLKTPAYGAATPVAESFSSTGPTDIYYDTSGNRLASAQIRQTPQIVAVDGGNTSFFGSDITGDADSYPNFFGTSAAAPDAAAVAALMLQANGQLTPADVKNLLIDSAIDMASAGYDNATGAGLIQADRAVGFASTLTIANAGVTLLRGTHLADAINASSGDTVDGGDGQDVLSFRASGTIDASRVTAVETIRLPTGGSNSVVLSDTNFTGVASGTIAVYAGGSGDIVTDGAIVSPHALAFTGGAGGDQLVLAPGNTLASADGGGGTNILELAAGVAAGALSGFGSTITNFGAIRIDDGAVWALAGLSSNGNATVSLGVGSRLTLTGAVGAQQIIDFTASTGSVIIGTPGAFAGEIAGFRPGDVIGVAGTITGTPTFSRGILSYTADGQARTIRLDGDFGAAVFSASQNGGESDITATFVSTVPELYRFVYVYGDAQDYYYGSVVGVSGQYIAGQRLDDINPDQSGNPGYYQILSDQGQASSSAVTGTVRVDDYYVGINNAYYVPYLTAHGMADGTSGLGSEFDYLAVSGGYTSYFGNIGGGGTGTDRPYYEASREPQSALPTLYSFVYVYGDGADYYYGTVSASSGTLAIGQPIQPASADQSGSRGYYEILSSLGVTSDAIGNVRVGAYYLGIGAAYFTPYSYAAGGISGTKGLGSEFDYLAINGGYSSYFGNIAGPGAATMRPYYEAGREPQSIVPEQYRFVYVYGDNSDYYYGIVTANSGTYQVNQILRDAGPDQTGSPGFYQILSNDGRSSAAVGSVSVSAYFSAAASHYYTPYLASQGQSDGAYGLGTEFDYLDIHGGYTSYFGSRHGSGNSSPDPYYRAA